jgi:soluble cytochrome b562
MFPQKYLLRSLAFIVACLLPISAFAEETKLDGIMEKLNGAMRRANKNLSDPAKNADTLKDVGTAKEQAELAKKETPALAKEKADPTTFVADYQKQMDLMIAELGKMEAALKANDNAAAKEIYKKINDLKKSGHKDFKKPDKKE